jgi:CO/xanthine dehydrogenase FAD-binding subunit
MVLLEAGKLAHKNYINIRHLNELRCIDVSDQHVTLGALTTYTDVQANPVLREEFPMLCQAASETGGLAIQNRGTLGGNIMNASPAADSPPALLAYDAALELLSINGSRWVSYEGFHTGYKQMIIRPDELLGRIRLPRTTRSLKHYYRKVGTRKAQAISKICFAAVIQTSGNEITDLRIALGSVAPTPIRCVKTESSLRGKTISQPLLEAGRAELGREIVPIDDLRSTANYRTTVSLNLLQDFLSSQMSGKL